MDDFLPRCSCWGSWEGGSWGWSCPGRGGSAAGAVWRRDPRTRHWPCPPCTPSAGAATGYWQQRLLLSSSSHTRITNHVCNLQPRISCDQLGLLQPHKWKEFSLFGTCGTRSEAILTSSLGASCNTTGVSSENRVWMAFATLSRLKGTAWKTKAS